jgi:hypothetical protein
MVKTALLLLLMLSTTDASVQLGNWPPGPKLSCSWEPASSRLQLSWNAVTDPKNKLPADIYEIQVADSLSSRAAAIFTSSALNATFGTDFLLPKTTYYVSVRAHAGWAFLTGRAMGAGTWGKVGPITSCTTGDFGEISLPKVAKEHVQNDTFTFAAWRISEYSSEVDYLPQHDSADKGGSSLLITGLAQFEAIAGDLALHNSWTGGSVADAVISTYCVDALKPAKPGTVTTRGSTDFADYQSCNDQPDKSAPNCTCAIAVDRLWGRLALPSCHKSLLPNQPCTQAPGEQCVCNCSAEATANSESYIGMIPAYAQDDSEDAPSGHW